VTRVDEGRVEQERVQQDTDRKAREDQRLKTDKQAFAKLVDRGQKSTKETQTKQQEQLNQAKQGARLGSLAKESAKLAAPASTAPKPDPGASSRALAGTLARGQADTEKAQASNQQVRTEGKDSDRVEQADRQQETAQADDVERAHTDGDRDVQQAQSQTTQRAERDRVEADGERQKKQQPQQQQGGERGADAVKETAGPARHDVQQISPALLEKLASTVFLAVNERGLKEFQIELKDGPLQGAFVKISADKGRVALSFSNVDAQTANLLEASKGDLMRRFDKKGLQLARFEIHTK
jgi:hypothetical protein